MEKLMDAALKALLEEIKEGKDPQLVEATANLIKAITDYKINF
ncbi:hypothetical protein [Salinicoccus sp. ID82-1]|nr:hypothetical protein [Salinicoccus sp. ID82-1]